jgi:MFS family permease
LLELRFFRSVPFSGATLTAIAGFAALSGFLFLTTLYLQETRGFSVLHAGLLTLPMAVLTAVGAPLSGRLTGVRGPRLPLLVAGAGIAASGVVLAGIGPATPIAWVVTGYVCFGIGYGLLNAPITNAAVSGMPREQAGLAAAVASTSRQVGTSLGVAVIGAVVAADVGTPPGTGHAVWAIVAGCGVVVFALGLVTTGRWALATAARVGNSDHDGAPVA